MQNLTVTLILAFLGGLLLQKKRVPGGMMLGSVTVVALLNINTNLVEIPGEFRFVAQCIAGAYIGMTVKKKDLGKLRTFIRPTLTLLLGLFITNLLVGILIHLVSPLDLLTSFLSAIPGGISDTPLIAADLGADATKVTVLQFVRLISGLAMVPMMVKRTRAEDLLPGRKVDLLEPKASGKTVNRTLLLTLLVALIFSFLGKYSGIPAGTLLFAMFGVVLLKLFSVEVSFPTWFKRVAQLFSGAYIGSHFGYADVMELKYLLLPALIIVVFNVSACFIMGNILHRRYQMPLSQGILSSSPAGASDMALMASDIGVSGSDVAMIQIFRLLGAVTVFPQLFLLITRVFG